MVINNTTQQLNAFINFILITSLVFLTIFTYKLKNLDLWRKDICYISNPCFVFLYRRVSDLKFLLFRMKGNSNIVPFVVFINNSSPSNAAMSTVTLCWPSIKTLLPFDEVVLQYRNISVGYIS